MSATPDPGLGHLTPYVVATHAVAAHLDLSPLGQIIAPEHLFDPLHRGSAPFLHRIEDIDRAEFGAAGMIIPRWALYDCAELPGLITGLGHQDEQGFCPLSMMIAIPMMGHRRWLIYGMACPTTHLRFATMALGLGLVRAGEINFTTQWASPELSVVAHFAPLELRAARFLIHDIPQSCMLRFTVDPDRIEQAIAGTEIDTPGAELLDVLDDAVLERLQRAIAAGQAVQLVGQPQREGAALKVPFLIGAKA
jgi:hypothetical protein